MRYLYGDSTPFPLGTNFLTTIEAVTDACVALLKIDLAEAATRHREHRRRRDTENELAQLEALGAVIEQDICQFLDQGTESLRVVAGRVAEELHASLRETRTTLLGRVAAPKRSQRSAADGAAIERWVAGLLAQHDMPGARWRSKWTAGRRGQPARAQAACTLSTGIEATFAAEIEPGEPWHSPRVGDHVRFLSVPTRGLREVTLDRYIISELELSPQHQIIRMARSAREPWSVEVVVRGPGCATPTVRRANETTALSVEPAVAEKLLRLRDLAAEGVATRVCRPETMRTATLRGTPLRSLDRPKAIAAALLETVGAFVREVRCRSRVPGELTLKRERGDGHRDELFVSHAALRERYADLPSEYRTLFSSYGFEPVDDDAPTGRIHLRLPLPPD